MRTSKVSGLSVVLFNCKMKGNWHCFGAFVSSVLIFVATVPNRCLCSNNQTNHSDNHGVLRDEDVYYMAKALAHPVTYLFFPYAFHEVSKSCNLRTTMDQKTMVLSFDVDYLRLLIIQMQCEALTRKLSLIGTPSKRQQVAHEFCFRDHLLWGNCMSYVATALKDPNSGCLMSHTDAESNTDFVDYSIMFTRGFAHAFCHNSTQFINLFLNETVRTDCHAPDDSQLTSCLQHRFMHKNTFCQNYEDAKICFMQHFYGTVCQHEDIRTLLSYLASFFNEFGHWMSCSEYIIPHDHENTTIHHDAPNYNSSTHINNNHHPPPHVNASRLPSQFTSSTTHPPQHSPITEGWFNWDVDYDQLYERITYWVKSIVELFEGELKSQEHANQSNISSTTSSPGFSSQGTTVPHGAANNSINRSHDGQVTNSTGTVTTSSTTMKPQAAPRKSAAVIMNPEFGFIQIGILVCTNVIFVSSGN